MIVETVITSVPRGLKAGRTGYQPVMRTRGLRDDVLRQLEPLTGYRHIHRQGSGKNPVNYAYRRLASNVGDLAVLARTVDAGSDFSNRSNKCGHLIAFTADEIGRLSRTTPAALLADNQALFTSQWTKGPEERPAPPALAAQPQTPAICTTWQSKFGDGGWAAVVAERARRRQPTLLVAADSSPLSSDLLLRLIREATALLPPADRWAVSFETTVLGASDALIQGTYRGSPEAEATRQGVLVLPLGGPVPPGALQENDLCNLARFGPPQPAAAPPPVAPTTTVPTAPDDFLSDSPTAPVAGSPPPLLPSTPNRRVGSFEPLPEEKRAKWKTIIPFLVLVLFIAFWAAWFVVASNWPETVEKKEPPQQNVNAPQDGQADLGPQDVLSNYLSDFHQEKGPANLTEPSIGVWQQWLKARIAEEKINKEWVSYANAILRRCTTVEPDPFARAWSQKEKDFYEAVQNISQLKPTTSDLNFLLVANDLTESNEADAFTKDALNAYEKGYGKKEKPNRGEIIDTAIQANKLHEKLRGFLSKKPQNEDSEDKQLAELVSDYSKATWLPRINGDKNGQLTKFFLLSLRNQTASPDTRATAPTFDSIASFTEKFNKALSDLEAYAKNSENPNDRTTPSEDTYQTAYGTNLQPTTDGPTVQDLNKAILAIGAVPDTLQPILDAARLIKEWGKLRSDFGKHAYDPQKRKVILAKGLNFPKEIRGRIKPVFATTTVASEGSNPWKFFLNQEPSCTVEWEEDGTKLVAEFYDTPKAEVLLRLPLVIELDSDLKIAKQTEPVRITKEPLKFTTRIAQNQTIATFAKSGGTEYFKIKSTPNPNTSARLADLVESLKSSQLRWSSTVAPPQLKPLTFGLKQNGGNGPRGEILLQCETPTTQTQKRSPNAPYGPEETLSFEISYSYEPTQDRLKLDARGLKIGDGLASTFVSLKSNTVGKNMFIDIAYAVHTSYGKTKRRQNELKNELIKIVNEHAFGGQQDDDFFGEKPLYGENFKSYETNRGLFQTLFEINNFSDPNNKGTLIPRALVGKAKGDSLEDRSWEMVFASYLIKHSEVFTENKNSFAKIEKKISEIDESLHNLKEDAEKNKEDIGKKNEEKRTALDQKNQIKAWLQRDWLKEDLRAIAASVRREAAKKQSDEGRRTEIAARLFLNLRPFLARYLLANDLESQKIPLSSLLSTEIWFNPKSGDFGREFLLAVINPSPLADNIVPPKASDEQTSPDITDQQP